MVEQDYIMRMIHQAVRALLLLVFRVDTYPQEEIVFEEIEREMMYRKLKKLIDEGNINEAENELLEWLDAGSLEDMKLALVFYDYLNQKSADYLEEHDFSQEEVRDGIKYVTGKYGYAEMMNTLVELDEV